MHSFLKEYGSIVLLLSVIDIMYGQIKSSQYTADKYPDRINITIIDDPSTSFAVNWRTDSTMIKPTVEIALASDSSTSRPELEMPQRVSQRAMSEELLTNSLKTLHHSFTFKDLEPKKLYAFRVGQEPYWSEWFHYRTASNRSEPFSFIYLGDAQNNIKSMWSRTVRKAYADAPDAAFILHAGDLINKREDWEWDEWFYAGSFIHSMIPTVPVTGNHEHQKTANGRRVLIPSWNKQFTLPDNGPKSSNETDYYIDYQGVKIIVLNSSLFQDDENYRKEQIGWLNQVLSTNRSQWTLISYHHPMSKGVLAEELKPILEKYDVDLALQGHVHSYSRGITWNGEHYESGPIYTVSVSGPKHYPLNKLNGLDMIRSGTDMQLYQIIQFSSNKLEYQAYTTSGKLYDHFEIIKRRNKKRIINHIQD